MGEKIMFETIIEQLKNINQKKKKNPSIFYL